jgi:uncharacterized protein (TIGR03086 family)
MTITPDPTLDPTLHPTDPRAAFAQAVFTARSVIAGVRSDQLGLPTPCPEHDVRSMLGHMLTVFRRITALGNGDDPMAMPDVVSGVPDDGWNTAFLDAADQVQSAWSDPAKLDRMMVLPWVTAPGAAMLHMYTSELTVHTWDLAVASGQAVQWHEPTVHAALESALQALPPGDREAIFAAMAVDMPEIAGRPPFKNPIDAAADAPTIDRLVGWYGRQPASRVA